MNEKVTVWIGNFESNDEFENYTNIKYTEDGDSIPSIFEQHFNLGYYDRDLVEKKWIFQPLTNNIQDLLKGFSYYEQFTEQFDNIIFNKECNTAILVYNFEYNARKTKITYKNNELKCIGVAQYTVIADDRW
ncbi:immunity 22 family protein [Bacillus cereus group sp. N21]|uniref:immunity 22 family protein n=1 Tax=Bacillus cereus group sp. N21 TaxID=2794591 RepID=UPI0018F29598|nr:immunity 22 family protein [Bacillus cereus group sp. N21]MBJ8029506.1 immunity 22 family protein [Bacillus cereus group sp. N21]